MKLLLILILLGGSATMAQTTQERWEEFSQKQREKRMQELNAQRERNKEHLKQRAIAPEPPGGFKQAPGQPSNQPAKVVNEQPVNHNQVCLPREEFDQIAQQLDACASQIGQIQQQSAKFQQMEQKFKNPITDKFKDWIMNKEIREAGSAIYKKLNYKKFLILQLASFLFVMFLRTWLTGRARGTLGRMGANIFSSALLFVLLLVVCPTVAIGRDYIDFILMLIRS